MTNTSIPEKILNVIVTNNSTLSSCPETEQNILYSLKYGDVNYCPIPTCLFTGTHYLNFAHHLTSRHYDAYADSLPLDNNDKIYKPNALKGSRIAVIKSSRRAICCASLVYLRRQEVPYHITSCRACSSKWNFTMPFVHLPQITNKKFDVNEPHAGLGMIVRPSKSTYYYKIHEYYVDSTTVPYIETNSNQPIVGATFKVCKMISVDAKEKPIRPPAGETSFQHQMVLHMQTLRWLIDICTLGNTKKIIQRVGYIDKNIENMGDHFFIHEMSSRLTYPVHDAIEIECILNGISKPRQIGAENAARARRNISIYLYTFLQIITKKIRIETFVFKVKDGKLYTTSSGDFLVPWCFAEMIMRYYLLIRPLQQKYDHLDYIKEKGNLTPNVYPSHVTRGREMEIIYSDFFKMHAKYYRDFSAVKEFKTFLTQGYGEQQNINDANEELRNANDCFLLEPY